MRVPYLRRERAAIVGKFTPTGKPKKVRGIFYGDLTPLTPRVPFFRREKAAIIKIRRQGVSINQLTKAFGRSTSCIHRIVKNAERYGLEHFDKRKLPPLLRRRSASFRWQTLMNLMPKWIAWITESVEKPP